MSMSTPIRAALGGGDDPLHAPGSPLGAGLVLSLERVPYGLDYQWKRNLGALLNEVADKLALLLRGRGVRAVEPVPICAQCWLPAWEACYWLRRHRAARLPTSVLQLWRWRCC
ncbi:hypothetical protein [Candidatus Nephthysia bennettiae]|uniref:hypothetical protein n=1 Tax=Candidatus Nephthysia bennettiae TaxID=3127016 RepID=UPI0030C6999A